MADGQQHGGRDHRTHQDLPEAAKHLPQCYLMAGNSMCRKPATQFFRFCFNILNSWQGRRQYAQLFYSLNLLEYTFTDKYYTFGI